MTGQIQWAVYGGIALGVGVSLLLVANRRRRIVPLSISVGDGLSMHASLVAHKQGPSGEGFPVEDGRTSISVDGDPKGVISSTIKAPARHGEEGNDKVCAILISRFNKNGSRWVECDCDDSATRDTDADCKLYEMSKQEMQALHPMKRKKATSQDVQITRSIHDQRVWQEVGGGGTATFTHSTHEATHQLRAAIDKKKDMARKELILALDARETPGQVMVQVVEEFRKTHSAWAGSLGFKAIWLVGPTAELTFQLD